MSGRLVAALVGVVAVAAIAAVVVFLMFGGGGEEEGDNVVLAVAFRLDGGSPVLSGYIGDPGEDAFELAAGRYYIEAVDQDDVIVSLGAVDMEEGEAVEFPESFEAVGGVADAERVEPLLTMAEFLVDVELAKLMFLEIVTGGYTELPFDPTVDLDAADSEGLVALLAEIAEQEDAVLDALDKIEGRAEVSLDVRYVGSGLSAPPGGFEEIAKEVLTIFMALETASSDPFSTFVTTQTPEEVWDLATTVVTAPRETPENSSKVPVEEKRWQEYAKKRVGEVGAAEAWKDVEERIKSDFLKAFPDLRDDPDVPDAADRFAKMFVKEVMAAAVVGGEPEATATSAPEPEATATTPAGEGTVAKGKALAFRTANELGVKELENEVWLRFNPEVSGPVTGEAHLRTEGVWMEQCGAKKHELSLDISFKGTYDADLEKFEGTYEWKGSFLNYEFDPGKQKCSFEKDNVGEGDGTWQGGRTGPDTVAGVLKPEDYGFHFRLTMEE